ncbi:hypothetical protein LAZ40_04330 [Cereibacter sphaeroides]|uniref:hypothetical protein n=1 Tax=Cereibacter sphaeroides TaxID=1063 RepID=UPI001F3CA16D|nr:hypothetical protein [Cereibacter sphaeroides]MCE6958282.1 hypothetical protein [Cereibacter sphaeroides]MCE6971892.1 hypothetical protein [Cereibacter sphaeroides]
MQTTARTNNRKVFPMIAPLTAMMAVGIALSSTRIVDFHLERIAPAEITAIGPKLCLSEVVVGATDGMKASGWANDAIESRVEDLRADGDAYRSVMPSSMTAQLDTVRQAGHDQALRGEWSEAALEGYLDALDRDSNTYSDAILAASRGADMHRIGELVSSVTHPASGATAFYETIASSQVAELGIHAFGAPAVDFQAADPVALRLPVVLGAEALGFLDHGPDALAARYGLERNLSVELPQPVTPAFGPAEDDHARLRIDRLRVAAEAVSAHPEATSTDHLRTRLNRLRVETEANAAHPEAVADPSEAGSTEADHLRTRLNRLRVETEANAAHPETSAPKTGLGVEPSRAHVELELARLRIAVAMNQAHPVEVDPAP